MSECRAFACAEKGCQATIHLHHDIETRLLRTHETFYCPAGHSNYFPGKTTEEKRIEELTHKQEILERRWQDWRDRWEQVADERDEWRLIASSCPFECGYRVLRKRKPENIAATLAMHLVEEHGAKLPVPEEAEVV